MLGRISATYEFELKHEHIPRKYGFILTTLINILAKRANAFELH